MIVRTMQSVSTHTELSIVNVMLVSQEMDIYVMVIAYSFIYIYMYIYQDTPTQQPHKQTHNQSN